MTSELLPCPFCKEQERLFVQRSIGDACWGKCLECGAEGPLARTEQEAIAAWNTRAERTCRNVDDYGDNIGGWRDWETDGFGFTCSECKHVLYPDEMGVSPLAPELLAERVKINYCPNCGAKVVE